MRIFKIIALAAGIALSMAPAHAAPVDESCAFVKALSTAGAQGGIDQLMKMASGWSQDDAAKLGPLIGPVLAKFQYADGEVYSIAALGNMLHEHLVVMGLTTGGAVYMRLLYEGNGDGLSFINIDFQAKYHDILKKPVLQEPVRMTCF